MSKKDSLVSSATHIPLMEKERDIFDLVCSLNLMELHQNIIAGQTDSPIYTTVVKSIIFFAIIPQTYVYLEFITWLVSSLYLQKCFVMNGVGENIFQVSILLIQLALDFPSSEHYTSFTKETMVENFQICL